MNIAICLTRSPGLQLDAEIVASTLSRNLTHRGFRIILIEIPKHALTFSSPRLADFIKVDATIDITIFLEQIVNHPKLISARHTILIPNPEWLHGQSAQLAHHCELIWHKTRFSLDRLSRLYPQARHEYIGFTSLDPGVQVGKHATFLHPRGNLHTQRNTRSIVDAWLARPQWPDLYVHVHGDSLDIDIPGWLTRGNLHLCVGWLDRPEYLAAATTHGIHLCTSEAEGFGHYINEARAMGALVVTTDAPPMNELIDRQSGVLVPSSEHYARGVTTGYKIDRAELSRTVEHILDMPEQARKTLGAAARQRFQEEKTDFETRLSEAMHACLAA